MRDVYDSISNGGEGGEHSQLHTKQRVGGAGGREIEKLAGEAE